VERKSNEFCLVDCCAARRVAAVRAYVIEAVYVSRFGEGWASEGIRDQSIVTGHGSRDVFNLASGVTRPLTPSP
jgi:hypothetical protein